MKFEHTQTFNWQGAFRGLRNPLESWQKSDSKFDELTALNESWWFTSFNPELGQKDLDLAQRMIKAGDSDSKFLRQIFVSVDITAPLYWWKQADTYKVATVANSTSTMHKLASTPITLDCFEIDDFQDNLDFEPDSSWYKTKDFAADIIQSLQYLRLKYLETKDKKYWKELIRWLPEGWLQTRTWTANYAVLRNIYFQRQHHKLTEWHQFCKWIEELPYAKELILYTGQVDN